MKAILFFAAIAVALCAVVVTAQHPRHCDAPFEFGSHAMQWDHKEKFERHGHYEYDAVEERTSLFEEVTNDTDHEFYHTIHLYREHRRTLFNLKTKVCVVEPLDRPFHRIEIPHDAKFVGDAIVGTNAFPGAGVLTTHWHHHHDKDPKFEWYGVFTDRDIGCVPVMDMYHDDTIGTIQSRFFDVVLGTADPNVFIPEPECKRSEDQ